MYIKPLIIVFKILKNVSATRDLCKTSSLSMRKFCRSLNIWNNSVTYWRFICASSWRLLTVCYILMVFIYCFHLLSTSLQEASFYHVKDSLSKDERPYLADWKDAVWKCNYHRASQNNSANGYSIGHCTLTFWHGFKGMK